MGTEVTLLAVVPPEPGEPLPANKISQYTCARPASDDELARLNRRLAEQDEAESQLSAYIVPVSAWEEIERTTAARLRATEDGTALVSLAFCHPSTVVFRDLTAQFGHLDRSSGTAWNLHFIGYRCPGKRVWPPTVGGIPLWQFQARDFDLVRRTVQTGHALTAPSLPDGTRPWRYSGRPELVSFMAYRDHPGLVDWLSLRAAPLVDPSAGGESLGEVVEVLSDWREVDGDALRRLAPGEPPVVTSTASITAALRTTAAALAGGITGNAADDLLRTVTG